MTSRQAFEDILDKWITYLRQINYNNTIILFGTKIIMIMMLYQ